MFWSERETFILSSSDMILAIHRNESRNVLFVGLEEMKARVRTFEHVIPARPSANHKPLLVDVFFFFFFFF